MLHLWGKAYSHLSEEERQVIQIEIGNGTSIRRIGLMPGRNTWFRPTRTSPTGRTGQNG